MRLRGNYLFQIVAILTGILFSVVTAYLPSISRAESIQIFATIAADAEDFQLELTGPSNTKPWGPGSILTYTLTYGSHLLMATDVLVLQATWSQGTTGTNTTMDLLKYVEGSATPALGGAKPIVDYANRTITWQISPMPSGTDHVVSWQLQTQSLKQDLSFTVSATLIGPGIEKPATPLHYSYSYIAPSSTPSTTPTSNPSPVLPSPSEELPSPISNWLYTLEPLLRTVTELTNFVAENGGALVVAPIPLLLVLIPALTQLITMLGQIPWWQILPLVAALFWSRPKRPWGVVYDAATKQPIDPAIITLIDESGVQRTTLSDFYGRYQFLVDPGTYSLTVKKAHYKFPSTLLAGKAEDGIYTDLYFGGQITVTNADAITYNIPLDPISLDWNQIQKQRYAQSARRAIVWQWLFWIGLMWSLLMLSLSASLLNSLVVGMYILLLGLRWLQRLRSPWGVVYDQHGRPIHTAIVSLINLNNPMVKRPPVVTNQSGRYAYLVERGEYQLHVSIKTGDNYTAPSPGPVVEVTGKQGHIATDLTVMKIDDKLPK